MKTKRIVSIALVLMLFTAMMVPALAASHGSPSNPCNNTGVFNYHGSEITAQLIGNHYLSNNGVCSQTQHVYNHTQKCNSCYYVLDTKYSLPCRIYHSNIYCGNYPYQKSSTNCIG